LGKEIKKFKKMKKLLCLLAILMPMLSVDCFAQTKKEMEKEIKKRKEIERENKTRVIELNILRNDHCDIVELSSPSIYYAPQFKFQVLKKGLNINIEPAEAEFSQSETILSLSNETCFIMPTVEYIKAMGFHNVGEIEHTLNIYFKKIDVYLKKDERGYYRGNIDIKFQIKMTNRDGEVIFEQVVSSGVNNLTTIYHRNLAKAYLDALSKINWHKIASLLNESSAPKQQVKQESKEVKGYGNTDLENTIVRWEVQSRPAGADVFWRVVSKTPEVKSTNNKYLQTTPYEATKSLDIRGLSYENSGDVRIILRCEKEGYHSQEKEFNVRMIIDQEEISAFFRLVKVE
jgi:hypothetical protein